MGHAHEMLFGFALAVVAGNQLGPMPVPRLALLVGLWAIARVTFLLTPQTIIATAANIAFATLLAAHLAPRLLSAAKKLRNQALPLVLLAICASSVALEAASHAGATASERKIPIVGVVLFAMLMLFMGGRLIAPMVAGQFHRQGSKLEARVQPRIESALLIAMTVAVAGSVFANQPPFVAVAAAALSIAGVLAAVRLVRWRLWALRGRPDLLCLAAGYGWLVLGLVLYGAALVTGHYEIAALHLITVGSLGTLTLNVMAITWTLKARLDPSRARATLWATLLVGAATLARALAGLDVYHRPAWLLVASLCWSSAFALLLIRLARVQTHRSRVSRSETGTRLGKRSGR
jgi:uncharacterized protein involved in response to NO